MTEPLEFYCRTMMTRTGNFSSDVLKGLKRADLWAFLGWHDIRQRYRRSTLGPLWITLATAVVIGGMTILYSGLFKQDIRSFLPFVASGIVIWSLISGCISEGCNAFISASATIKQVPAPLTVHVFRMVWSQLIYFLHNCIILLLALIVTGPPLTATSFLFVPAMFLLVVNLSWMTLMLATICARFRDVPLIVQSLMTALFMMTPVLWRLDFLPPERQWVASFNPFTHLLEVVRAPLLGSQPPLTQWLVVAILAVCGWIGAISLYARSRHKIAYWV